MYAPWLRLATDTTMLAFEANAVIGLRLTKFALGKGTSSETHRMVAEKAVAFIEAAGTLLTGGSAHKVVSGYRKHVRENVRRLAG